MNELGSMRSDAPKQGILVEVPRPLFGIFVTELLSKVLFDGEEICGYFDRQGHKEIFTVKVHVDSADTPLLAEMSTRLSRLKADHAWTMTEIGQDASSDIAAVLTGEDAAKIYFRYSRSTMPHIIDWARQLQNTGRKKLSLAFDLMSLHILNRRMRRIYRGGDDDSYPPSYLSFRAHADGFLAWSNKDRELRNKMDSDYAPLRAQYGQRFAYLRTSLRDGTLEPHLRDWTTHMENTFTAVENAIRADVAGYAKPTFDTPMSEQFDIQPDNLLHDIDANRHVVDFMTSDKGMEVARIVTSFLYLTLHRLGLNRIERYYLCHMICRTVEDLYSVSLETAKDRFQRALLEQPVEA